MTRELRVHRIDTGEVIHRVDVTGKSDRAVERTLGGMLINADTDQFYIADSADDEAWAVRIEDHWLVDGTGDHGEFARDVAEAKRFRTEDEARAAAVALPFAAVVERVLR